MLRSFFFISLLSFNPLAVAKTTVDRGDFAAFGRSLSKQDSGYQIVKDPTGKAPTVWVEKFLVKNGDCGVSKTWNDCTTDRERSELSEKARTNFDEKTFWYGWSLYLPENFPQIFPAKVALGQFLQEPGDPLWMFQQGDFGLALEAVFLPGARSFSLIPWSELRGRWHQIEVEVRWSQKTSGFFRVWVNGQLKADYQGPTKKKENVYFKYGLYRSFLSRYKSETGQKELPAQEVFYSNVKRAKSKKGLAPHG